MLIKIIVFDVLFSVPFIAFSFMLLYCIVPFCNYCYRAVVSANDDDDRCDFWQATSCKKCQTANTTIICLI